MINVLGCPFCNQQLMLEEPIDDDSTLLERNEAAARICTCSESGQFRHILHQITVGEFNLEQLIGDDAVLFNILKPTIKSIGYGKIKKLTVNYEEEDKTVKLTISLNSDKAVKIAQSKTSKEVRE